MAEQSYSPAPVIHRRLGGGSLTADSAMTFEDDCFLAADDTRRTFDMRLDSGNNIGTHQHQSGDKIEAHPMTGPLQTHSWP